jgi:hypothetical protein
LLFQDVGSIRRRAQERERAAAQAAEAPKRAEAERKAIPDPQKNRGVLPQPLTDARLRQCCFLFRGSHRDYGAIVLAMLTIGGPHYWQGVSKGGGQWRPHGVNF